MSIQITSIQGVNEAASGLSVTWQQGQFVIIVAEKGLLACGIVDFEVATKFNFAVAIAHGSPEKPLVTPEDLLEAQVSEVTKKAEELGIRPGMSGREVLKKLTS